jgi:XTP/dITP diphosphohydrolase
MKKLLVATTNPGKLAELQEFLSDLPIKLVSLKDVGITAHVEETGMTFEENAIIKSKHYAKNSGLPTIADDGGLEIDALGGEPGVKSHRWIHKDREDEDEELIQHALIRLKDVSLKNRGAQLHLVIAFTTPDGKTYTSEGMIRGIIPLKDAPYRHKGFPYRSLLYLPKLQKFYNHDELTEEENKQYNHRKIAVEQLKPIIRKKLT